MCILCFMHDRSNVSLMFNKQNTPKIDNKNQGSGINSWTPSIAGSSHPLSPKRLIFEVCEGKKSLLDY